MTSKDATCLAVVMMLFSGCAGTDPMARKDCTRYEEETYTQYVCAEVKLDCDYNLSGQQLCRTADCAREVPRLATRQVCMSYVCKEGFVKHSDGECYTPEEIAKM